MWRRKEKEGEAQRSGGRKRGGGGGRVFEIFLYEYAGWYVSEV